MTRFFATFNDMRIGLEKVEQEYSLKYVVEGMYTAKQYPVYYSFVDIPALGITNTARAGTPAYLVFKDDYDINARVSTI